MLQLNVVQNLLQHPHLVEALRRKVVLDHYLKKLNLEWLDQYIEENNKGRHNPYHSNDHMRYVALTSVELYQLEGFSKSTDRRLNTIALLLVSSLLHDFNHSGGVTDDAENIRVAIEEGVEPIAGTLEKQFNSYFVTQVIDLIRSTQYPYVSEPHRLVHKCLRDADAMQSFSTTGVTMIMENLRLEMEVRLQKKISYREMCDGQLAFLEKLTLHTATARALYDNLIMALRGGFESYAALREEQEPTNAKAG